jgi:peptidyl-prolyl cis-trans isomerase B (cyclophilin B)
MISRSRLGRTLLLTAGGLLANCACGQQSAGEPILGLQAEVMVERTLLAPGNPIRARFTLFNPTDQTIDIPANVAANDMGIILPPDLIFGADANPALFVSLQQERSSPVRPMPGLGDTQPTSIRLGPSASLGAEIDLQGSDRRFRYSGEFELEWRPFGGRIATATASFRVEARKRAILVTDYGKITFSLMYDQAPSNVGNLLELVRDRFYEGTIFHRIVPGFLMQGGSPDGQSGGLRPDGKTVEPEFHSAPFQPGTLAMALRGQDKHSASCQFFISLARLEDLDGKYTIVGQANDSESLRTLQKIAELPTDEDHRPLRPVAIRFFTLVDQPFSESDRVEISEP